MKKLIILLSITMLVGVLVFVFLRNKTTTSIKNDYKTTELSKVTINQVTYSSTGTISNNDDSGELALKELIALLRKVGFENKSFKLTSTGNGNLTIELFNPYPSSKSIFIQWLKDNGFSHIDPEQFTYVNVPK